MRLLLINPRSPESFWTFRWAVSEILPGKRGQIPSTISDWIVALSMQDYARRHLWDAI